MTRNTAIYLVHAFVVVTTAYIAALSSFASWYFVLLIGLPLVLASVPRFSGISYTINARILFPISVGLLCVALFHYFPQLMIDEASESLSRYGISNSTDGVQPEFFQVNAVFKDAVSVLYAICAAFLLWKGLSDFDELKHVLYEEANEVRAIADYTNYFVQSGNPEINTPAIQAIRERLLSYLNNMLEGNRIIANAENESVLEECLMLVGTLERGDLNDEIALAEIMKSLNRVAVLRSKRTVCIEKRMSPFILGLMLLMSITMVSSFFGKATGSFSIDYVYVFLLPSFYASIFMTLLDLSSPFDGYWSIKLEAVRGTIRKIEKQLNPSLSCQE